MNKEDVQYGDWFRYEYTEGGEEDGQIEYFYHDFRVNQIDFGMGIDEVSGEEGDIYSVEDIEPIPLTAEMLEKNFPNIDTGLAWFPEEDGFHIDTSYGEGDILICGKFHYVHQLQHALRLASIEKEIEL